MPANSPILSDKDLLFGYKQIVLYFENEVRKSKTGFNKRLLKGFLDNNHLENLPPYPALGYLLPHAFMALMRLFFISSSPASFPASMSASATSSNVEKNYQEFIGKKRKAFIYFSQKDYDIPMLIRLLRNVFAHGHIKKEKIGGHYYLLFFNQFNNVKTFAGQIPYSHFSAFIGALKGCRQ